MGKFQRNRAFGGRGSDKILFCFLPTKEKKHNASINFHKRTLKKHNASRLKDIQGQFQAEGDIKGASIALHWFVSFKPN